MTTETKSDLFEIGVGAGGPALLNARELVGAHLALVANSGSGKSRSLRKLLETTHGRIQHIVIDDEEEFYTLRERFDYIIAGGEGGDCPASPENAEALALALLENGLSAIVQTGSMDVADGQAFVRRFLTALLKSPKRLWHPALVVVDEAQRFAPNDGKVESSEAIAEFAAAARKRGFTLVVASGRFSSIDTKVRSHCTNWLIGRAGTTIDRTSAARELGFPPSSQEARGLKSLEKGEFYGFGPALAVEPTLFRFGNVLTTHLERGQVRVPTPAAGKKLRAILAELSKVAQPKTPAAPAESQEKVGQGRRASEPSAVGDRLASADELAAADQRGYERGLVDGEARALERGASAGWAAAMVCMQRDLDGFAQAIRTPRDHNDGEAEIAKALGLAAWPGMATAATAKSTAKYAEKYAEPMQDTRKALSEPKVAKPNGHAAPHAHDLKPALQRVLDALGWWRAAGQPMVPRAHACVVAGYSPKASTFGVYIGDLVKRSLVETGNGVIGLTDAGAAVAKIPKLTSRKDAREAGRSLLKPQEARVFDVIYDAYPEVIRREVVAEAVGLSPKASTLGVYIGAVASFGLVENAGRGEVKAASWLFEM